MALSDLRLNKNEIIVALTNLIIGEKTFSDNIGGLDSSLVDRAKIEGSMFGDTYLYNSADILQTYEFKPIDATQNGTPVPDQANLLIQHVPTKINQQAITLDVFRQIPITIEKTLTKRAFQEEGAWSDFVNVLSSLLEETRRVYLTTTYNAFIGTHVAEKAGQSVTVSLPTHATGTHIDDVAYNKLVGETIADKISDLFTELKDVSKDYNDLEYYRAYRPEDLVVVWNSNWVNQLKNLSLPEIYNSEELKGVFDFKNVLPEKYFGTLSSATTSVEGARALVEMTTGGKHYFAGEVVATGSTVEANSTYVQDKNIICKVMSRDSVPLMAGFQTQTSFWNAKALNENHYLTFAHNTLAHIKNFPMITVTAVTGGAEG